jgi:UPF0716 protein FxsA
MLLVLLILWPVAEVFVALQVADAIGVLATAVLLVAGWPIGTWALRSQGRAAWTRLRAELAAGRPPTRGVLDGALVLLGGLLLIIPGFIGDAVGSVLLLAPSRALARWALLRRLQYRTLFRAVRFGRPGRRPYDVDSTATDVDIRTPRPDPPSLPG